MAVASVPAVMRASTARGDRRLAAMERLLAVMGGASEEEGESGGGRAVLERALVGDERGVDRVVGPDHEAVGEVVARADDGVGHARVGLLELDQALVRDVVEAADADARERREALVGPGLGLQV